MPRQSLENVDVRYATVASGIDDICPSKGKFEIELELPERTATLKDIQKAAEERKPFIYVGKKYIILKISDIVWHHDRMGKVKIEMEEVL